MDETNDGHHKPSSLHSDPHHGQSDRDASMVARFLEQHPDFFIEHQDLATRLRLSHGCEPAVSLLEYQIRLLRERADTLDDRLEEIIDIARSNERIADQLHRLTLELLDCNDVEHALDTITDGLRLYFQAEFVSIRLQGPRFPECRLEVCRTDDSGFVLMQDMLLDQQPRCGELPAAHLRFLFGETASRIRSTAIVPMHIKTGRGLIAIGSSQPDRYDPGNGTVFLKRLGELCCQVLARLQ